jgi:membrane fusion protein, macrolide-specific efflux system
MKPALRRLRAHPWLTGTVALIVLAGAGLGAYFGTHGHKAAATTGTSIQTVGTGTVRQSVSAAGTVAPASEENLNFSVSGQVTQVAVSTGQTVKKGQKLATIDSAALSATVAQDKATVASDKAKVYDDSSNDATDTQIVADRAALAAANQQLASAERQLAAATLRSPINGVVVEVNLSVGESVSGSGSSDSSSSSDGNSSSDSSSSSDGNSSSSSSDSSSSSSSDPQVLVISTGSWVVNASVDANSVGLIKTGNQTQLAVTGARETVYGTISSIGLVSSSSSGTASYPVVIDVTGSPSGMHDGADVTATLIYRQVSNVVVVPTLALHRTSSGVAYVEQVEHGKTVHATVRVGISSGGRTQIVSGLSVGDSIVVPQAPLNRTGGNGHVNGGPGGGGPGPGGGIGG